MNIFELLEKKEMDPTTEFNRLVTLFNYEWKRDILYTRKSLKIIINNNFHELPVQLRRTCLSVDDLLNELEISENFSNKKEWHELFLYSELLENLIGETWHYIERDDIAIKVATQTISNMKEILKKTNHEWYQIKGGYVIIDKNPAVTEAIECLEEKDTELALKMIEYNRVLLKGNLDRKREILASMASYVEPMKNMFSGSIYISLYNDSRNMVNNLNIRHNNSGKDSLPEYAKKWSEKEFEEWYDNCYHTLLMVILAKKQFKITQEFNKLKSCGSKNGEIEE